MKILAEKSAKGIIETVYCWPGKEPFLRVYENLAEYRINETYKKQKGEEFDKNAWKFIDYKIKHYDFDVIIDEDHASFLTMEDGRHVLDYPSRDFEK